MTLETVMWAEMGWEFYSFGEKVWMTSSQSAMAM